MTSDSGTSERRAQTERDLAAALAELRARRDQLASQYDERLRQVEMLQKSLEDGTLEPKVIQDRIRQVLGDRAGIARTAKAGRTTIGMQAPSTSPTAAPTPVRMGPSITVAGATLAKAVHDLDARIGRLLADGGIAASAEVLVELGLLRQMRLSIARQQLEMPTDSVLLAAVMEHAETTQAVLHDLERGGIARARRIIEHGRELLAQLKALGAAPAGAKEQLVQAKATLAQIGDGASDEIIATTVNVAAGIAARAQAEIERRMPLQQRALLDQLLKSSGT